MRDSTITNYFKAIKREPVFETETFHLSTSLERTSTAIKSEQLCYIKEEIDIPDDISNTDSDCNSLCTKPCTKLVNRTCLIIINRLSDAVLQKYLTNENESEKIIEPDNLCNDNVENSTMKNQRTEMMMNNDESNLRKRKRSDSEITKFHTSTKKENIENFDANSEQKEIIEDLSWEKMKKRRKDGPFSTDFYRSFCPKCEKTYETRREVAKCRDCKTRLMYECKKCRKQLSSHHGMANHVRVSCVNQGYYYECFKCEFRSPLRNYVFRHLKRAHPNSFFPERIKRIASKEIPADAAPNIDECTKCGQQFSALYKLMKHVQLCHGSKDSKEYSSDYAVSRDKILRYCSKCDETIKDVGTDKKLCTKCQLVLAFKCSVCEKLYTSCAGAINHIVKNHIGKEWRCFKCDFKSGSMTSLTNHYTRMHNPKVFECTKCRTTLKSQDHLKKHLKQCGVKPHLHCAHCSYKTCVRMYLRNHIRLVHPQEDQSEDQSIACPKCQKMCKNDVILKKHLKMTCEKEANLQCEHCSFKTKFKCSIMKHILRHHSNGNKHECSKCKDQFKNHIRLKKHLLVCGIERSLQCKMCPYKTNKEQYLGWHVRNNH